MAREVIILLLFLQGFGPTVQGQNLVPNHSFEDQVEIGLSGSGNYKPTMWSDPPGYDTTEWGMLGIYEGPNANWPPNVNDSLFHQSCFLRIRSRPKAKAGSSYIGLQLFDTIQLYRIVYITPCCNSPVDSVIISKPWAQYSRAFASTKLSSTLKKDTLYSLEYSVHLDTWADYSTFQTKDFGIQLSSIFINQNDYLNQSFQNTYGPPHLIKATDGWVTIRHEVKGSGDEQYLTIGNFLPDSLSTWHQPLRDTLCAYYNSSPAQYYFDAIYLYKSSDTLFKVSLPGDTILCPGETMQLYARHDAGFKLEDTTKTFLWSTGSTDSTITAGPGTYWVKVTYNQRWWDADTITIEEVPPYETGLFGDSLICDNRSLRLQVPELPGYTYRWSNGSDQPYTEMSDSGLVSVTVTTPCETVTDTVEISLKDCTADEPLVFIPDAFTPNGDGLNDVWDIANLPERNTCKIYNRWGQLLHSSSPFVPWDGTSPKGTPLPPGIYVYKISYTYWPGITKQVAGSIHLIR